MSLAEQIHLTDEDAVRAVIHEETRSFMVGDIEAWKDCYLHDDRTTDVMSGPGMGLVVHRGWQNIYDHTMSAIARGKRCDMVAFEKREYSITIDRDTAWATYEGITHHADGRISENFETRIVERHRGRWKIVYNAFITKRSVLAGAPRIALDAEGHVIWMSDEAHESLRDHPGLTVSHDRLRARRPAWDSALQEAISRAATLHGYFDQFSYIHDTGDAFRCPVVLGEDDEGGIVTCVVTVSDGVTYVDIGGADQLARRLAAAAAIFGLSETQVHVAREIANGHPLPRVAERLGISANTVRTHLTRIFEKTGVNAQPALVRLLLSVG
ncbi:LuxR family transcriptional regulator [Alphaproteobacteria bacterium GH1-50]|uniref:LuxR family transcriptional regulator n=1 Tax=Kangsaoukella pontilimi TaxID=2691042 RepID=A0A7C9MYI5_9RHOB|nr:LuxR C-terminal-related transcriptional regulator [Kangsaoukella pontilimi]MXQ09174.1 LuxR family transcriptional regulator [Kangsaoukella pontilimi]